MATKGNQSLAAQVRDYLHENGICPQTGGSQLRCTKEGFYKSCAHFRKKAETNSAMDYRSYGRCVGCKEYPDEVEFCTIDELSSQPEPPKIKENAMAAKNSDKKEACGLCGNIRKLKQYQGVNVCTSCSIVLSYGKNNPVALLAALERFNNLPEAKRPGDGYDSDQQEKGQPKDSWQQQIIARVERLEKKGEEIMVLEAARKILFGVPA